MPVTKRAETESGFMAPVVEPFSKVAKRVDEKQTFADIALSLVRITDLNNDLGKLKEVRDKELQNIAKQLREAAKKVGTPEFQRDIDIFTEHLKENNPLLKSFVSGNLESIQNFLRKNGYFFEAFPLESNKDGYVKFAYAHGEENDKLREVTNEAGVRVTKRVYDIYGTTFPSSYLAIIPHLIRKDEHEVVSLIHQQELDVLKDKLTHVKKVSEGGKPDYEKLFSGHFFTDGRDVLPKEVYKKLDSKLVEEGLKNLFASNENYSEQKVIDFANKIRETTGHDDKFLEVKLLTLRMLFKASQTYDFNSQESVDSFKNAFTEMHKVHEGRHSKNKAWGIEISAADDERTAYLDMINSNQHKLTGIPFLTLSMNLTGYASAMEEKPQRQTYAHPSIAESKNFIECHQKAGWDITVDMARQAAEMCGIKGYPEKYLTDGDKQSILSLGRLDEGEIKGIALSLESSLLYSHKL